MLRYYRVFHIDDVEGINESNIPEETSHFHEFETIDSCPMEGLAVS